MSTDLTRGSVEAKGRRELWEEISERLEAGRLLAELFRTSDRLTRSLLESSPLIVGLPSVSLFGASRVYYPLSG